MLITHHRALRTAGFVSMRQTVDGATITRINTFGGAVVEEESYWQFNDGGPSFTEPEIIDAEWWESDGYGLSKDGPPKNETGHMDAGGLPLARSCADAPAATRD